jgi:hypothetical protein
MPLIKDNQEVNVLLYVKLCLYAAMISFIRLDSLLIKLFKQVQGCNHYRIIELI